MAAFVEQEALTDELVQIITGYSPTYNALAFRVCEEAASHDLRHHRFIRTNQFEVRKTMTGLVEKFSVLNNDALAQELEERLAEMRPQEDKWTPEVLSLLLLLSDDPVNKTKLEDLNIQSMTIAAKPLTWEQLSVDDPRSDDDIWDNVDFRAGSEDEDITLNSVDSSQDTNETRRSSITDLDISTSAETYVIPVNGDLLQDIVKHGKNPQLSELLIVRETVHMLLGLPTLIYNVEEDDVQIISRGDIELSTLSVSSVQDLLHRLASFGTDIALLRWWSVKSRSIPVIQTFFACLQDRLRKFDTKVIEIEQSFVSLRPAQVVSLVTLESTVQTLATRLMFLKDIATIIDSLPADESYRILDDLLDQVVMSQAIGDIDAFSDIADVFFRCLDTYLKPLRTWIEDGELGDSSTSVPITSKSGVSIADFWQERYALATRRDGTVKAPEFMLGLMHGIFSSGKSVAFMQELSLPLDAALTLSLAEQEEPLNLETVYGTEVHATLLPFSELLQSALDAWILRKHHNTWQILRRHLLGQRGLLDTMTALEYLYLGRDSAESNAFAFGIFGRLDAGKTRWHDPYFLEELARSCFIDSKSIDHRRIMATKRRSPTMSSSHQKDRSVKALADIFTGIYYSYPPYLQNIIPPFAINIYVSTSTLLLQLQRPTYLLTRKQTRSSLRSSRSVCMRKALRLRHNLHHNIFAIRSHMLHAIIGPSSTKLHTDFEYATDMSSLINAHADFITSLNRGCLLLDELEAVRRAVLSLADLAVSYADMFERWSNTIAGKSAQEGQSDTQDSDSDSDTGQDEDADGQDATKLQIRPLSDADFTIRLEHMHTQHDQLLGYIIAGLRTAARGVEGESSWTVLAEVLSWSPATG